MADTRWKRTERRTAAKAGTVRQPLSGRNAGLGSSSDSQHPQLYIEAKDFASPRSKGAAAWSLFETVRKAAKRERKLPILVFHKRAAKRDLALLDADLAFKLLAQLEGIPEAELWQMVKTYNGPKS